ncbi:MAG: ATP-binding cassette domain-containing protein [Coprococcus sp.]|nr:ATP-binding cassette domain-containing protein [Coprococcus sp.]
MDREILMQVKGIVKEFKTGGGIVHAVSGVDLNIYTGETLALVGESGCGKSTLGKVLMRLIPSTAGEILFDGENLSGMNKAQLREARKKMQLIFQDPYASLDPRMNVGKIISEPLRAYKVYKNKDEEEERVRALMDRVGIRPEFYNRYPHQFSGGQRQRVGIARALALNPKLIVCDEPVSALDVSIQAQILNLLHDLQDEFGLTYLFISHDLGVVRYISSRVCVMFLGRVCEIRDTETLYSRPLHPYTKFLLESTPQPNPERRKEDKELLSGEIPSPINPPSGCRFHPRCPYAQEICKQEQPGLKPCDGGMCACHFPLE